MIRWAACWLVCGIDRSAIMAAMTRDSVRVSPNPQPLAAGDDEAQEGQRRHQTAPQAGPQPPMLRGHRSKRFPTWTRSHSSPSFSLVQIVA